MWRGVHVELNWQLDGHNFQTSKFVGAVSKCYHHKGLRGKFRLDSFFAEHFINYVDSEKGFIPELKELFFSYCYLLYE